MAVIKSYTDIEQSRKLAEILPLESADMCWFEGEPFVEAVTGYEEERAEAHRQAGMEMYPCWSLAALLDVLPDYTLQRNSDGTVFVVCESKKSMISDAYDSPIDACYEMIIRLNELKML